MGARLTSFVRFNVRWQVTCYLSYILTSCDGSVTEQIMSHIYLSHLTSSKAYEYCSTSLKAYKIGFDITE